MNDGDSQQVIMSFRIHFRYKIQVFERGPPLSVIFTYLCFTIMPINQHHIEEKVFFLIYYGRQHSLYYHWSSSPVVQGLMFLHECVRPVGNGWQQQAIEEHLMTLLWTCALLVTNASCLDAQRIIGFSVIICLDDGYSLSKSSSNFTAFQGYSARSNQSLLQFSQIIYLPNSSSRRKIHRLQHFHLQKKMILLSYNCKESQETMLFSFIIQAKWQTQRIFA